MEENFTCSIILMQLRYNLFFYIFFKSVDKVSLNELTSTYIKIRKDNFPLTNKIRIIFLNTVRLTNTGQLHMFTSGKF